MLVHIMRGTPQSPEPERAVLMNQFVQKHLGGKKIILLFAATNIIYAIMIAVTIPRVMSYGGGMKLFDMSPSGYTVEYAAALLTALGEQGRSAYLFNQLPLDMLYPFLFGVTYCLIFAYFLRLIGKLNSVYSYICLLPLAAGVFDYLENFSIIAMLTTYPHISSALVHAASIFTILKSAFSTVFFVALILLLITVAVKKIFLRTA
jgi:hypothetical protein